jgi:hypothetical protein
MGGSFWGVDNDRIAPKTMSVRTGPVHCRERLGGLLKFYYREAAWIPRTELLHMTG